MNVCTQSVSSRRYFAGLAILLFAASQCFSIRTGSQIASTVALTVAVMWMYRGGLRKRS